MRQDSLRYHVRPCSPTPALLILITDMQSDDSGPVVVPFLGDRACTFLFDETRDDPDLRAALAALLDPKSTLLADAEPFVIAYCKDTLAHYPDDWERPPVKLEKPGDVWSYVQFGNEFVVSRRADGDDEDGIYFSLECNCDWEPEHGLQLVIRDGCAVTKVGSFDGHLTNADAFDDRSLAGVVYMPIGDAGP